MWEFINRLGESPDAVYTEVVLGTLVLGAIIIVVHLGICLLRRAGSPRTYVSWSIWDKLVYLLLIGATTVLAGTAWYAVWADGVLAGWLLMLHMSGAGALVAALPIAAVLWAQPSRFFVQQPTDREAPAQAPPTQFSWLTRLAFWALLAAGFVNVLTMLLSMLPLLDTHGLESMLTLHRYTGLAVVVALILHVYGSLLARFSLR